MSLCDEVFFSFCESLFSITGSAALLLFLDWPLVSAWLMLASFSDHSSVFLRLSAWLILSILSDHSLVFLFWLSSLLIWGSVFILDKVKFDSSCCILGVSCYFMDFSESFLLIVMVTLATFDLFSLSSTDLVSTFALDLASSLCDFSLACTALRPLETLRA